MAAEFMCIEYRLTDSRSKSVRCGTLSTPPTLRYARPDAGADRGRVGGAVPARRADAVTRRVEIHEVGVDREQVGGGVPETLGDAGAERLQHRVGAAHQLEDDLASFVGGDVDGDALLALQDLDRADLGERQDVPDRIAVELLDLDDTRAEVGEQRGAVRRGVVGAELEHGDARERRGAVRGRPARRRGSSRCSVRRTPRTPRRGSRRRARRGAAPSGRAARGWRPCARAARAGAPAELGIVDGR